MPDLESQTSDFSEQDRDREALRSSEERVRSLLESTGEGIYGIDNSGRCTFANRACANLLGYATPEELLGHPMHELIHHSRADGSAYPEAECPIYRSTHEGKGTQVEDEVFWRRDGTSFPVEYRSHPVLREGQRTGAVVTFANISSRKQTEQRLRREEQRYRSLVEASAAIVWTMPASGEFETEQLNWSAFTGQTFEELRGWGWLHAIHPDDRRRTAIAWGQAVEERGPYKSVHRLRCADGEYRDMSSRAVPILEADGTVVEWVGVHTDVTDRERAQATLRESEARFRQLAEAVPQIVWVARAEGYYEYFNQRWYDFTGLSEHDSIGLGWAVCLHPDDKERAEQAWTEATSGGEPFQIEYRFRSRDGDYRWFLGRALPGRDEAGRVARWFGTNTDIHDTKQAEERIRQAKEEAEQANQAKSLFLANMSHELRTPLNAILMYSELLMEEAQDAGTQETLADLEKIQSAGKHLLGLINNILDLSKVEAGKMDLSPETFDLSATLREVVETIEPLAQKNNNRLEVVFAPDLGSMHADLTKLRQCLFNLLSNACKFASGGTVTLSAQRERGAAEWIVFRVSDTGIGMTLKQVENLFQPFSQADASTTRKYGGTGLGLAITRRLSELMGGTVAVESQPGQGTTFILRLPTNFGSPARTVVTTGKTQVGLEGTAGTVLVIDDDPAVADLMVRFLSREGYRAVTAGDGEEGLRLAREIHPDVITLDVMMPRMDGWAVLRALKADPELMGIPVIMLTILDERNLGYLLGATEYMTKPINRERLGGLLRKYRPGKGGNSVLLVEDDEAMRRLLHGILVQQGWSVEEAKNGRVALEWLETQWSTQKRPELILLDLMMPELDGFEVIAGLRRRPEWRSIPVVVLTSKDLTEEDRARLNGGVEKVLQKGASTSDEVLIEVRRLLNTHM